MYSVVIKVGVLLGIELKSVFLFCWMTQTLCVYMRMRVCLCACHCVCIHVCIVMIYQIIVLWCVFAYRHNLFPNCGVCAICDMASGRC